VIEIASIHIMQIHLIRLMRTALILLLISYHIFASSIADDYSDQTKKLITAALTDSGAYKQLGYLCNTFGPRLSGSKNLEYALDWIIGEMHQDGFDVVKGEPVKVPVWVRGSESARLIKPFKKDLAMLGLGGSIGTPKHGIRADVLVVDSFAELEIVKDEVKRKIVLFNAPFTSYGETVQYRYKGASVAAKYGAVASLIRSVGSASLYTPHTGMMAYTEDIPRIPHAALTIEDAMMLRRQQESGEKIVIQLNMDARTEPNRWSRNIVADLKGSENPDEIVVLGGHIDSWDVGQGAHDDGGGCVAAWHAVKLIHDLGLRPKRTLRVVLWTNEENGGMGSKAYRDVHRHELDKHMVAIESDGGVFQPSGFGFTGSQAGREIIDAISKLLISIKANEITTGGRAADVAPLNDEGVPVMSLKVDGTKYFWYHHTNADTFDKIDFNEFNHCVAALAVMAYVLADMEMNLPR